MTTTFKDIELLLDSNSIPYNITTLGCEFEIKNLLKRFDEDPEYKEYLRLKAIYE